MKKKKKYAGQTVSVVVLGLLSIAMLYPMVWMFFTSFKTNREIRVNRAALLPKEWTTEGYYKAVTEAPFLKWLGNSVVITATVTIAVIITSSLVGFVFAKYQFKMKKTLFVLLLATMMVPGQVTMIPRFLIIQKLNLYNTLGALIVPGLVSAFGIYLCRQFIEDLPDSMCEAAKIDGASSFTIYSQIILPNIKPAIGSLAIFSAMGVWNDYLNPLLMLNDKSKMTLPLALATFSTEKRTDLMTTMAVASLIMIPMIIVFVIFQKQFVKGLALTGMK